MAQMKNFGDILREARISAGYDLTSVAQRLHLRIDILEAIENSDVAHMPPRSFSRNMINAYAKLLGINSSELVSMYLKSLYSNNLVTAQNKRQSTRDDGVSDAHARRRTSSTSGYVPRPDTRERVVSANGRRTYSLLDEKRAFAEQRNEDLDYQEQHRASSRNTRSTHMARGHVLPATHKTNVVGGGSRYRNPYRMSHASYKSSTGSGSSGLWKRILLIILALALIGGLAFAGIKFFGKKKTDNDAGKSGAAITGVADPAENGLDTGDIQNSATPIAPTVAVFSYEVKSGDSAYIEIKVDGSYVLADEVEGPAYGSYDVTGVLEFVTTNPDYVTLRLDGNLVEATAEDGSYIYRYTVDFAKILEEWKAENLKPKEEQPEEAKVTTEPSNEATKNNIKVTTQ